MDNPDAFMMLTNSIQFSIALIPQNIDNQLLLLELYLRWIFFRVQHKRAIIWTVHGRGNEATKEDEKCYDRKMAKILYVVRFSIFDFSLTPNVSSWENYSEFQRNYVLQVLPHVNDVNVRKLVNFLTSFGDAVLCTYRKLSHKRVEIECGELAWLCVICAALWKDPEKHFHHLSLSLLARRFESTSNISSSYDIRQHLWQINHASMDGMNGWLSLQVVQTCRVEKIMKLTNRENRISVRWEVVGGGKDERWKRGENIAQ